MDLINKLLLLITRIGTEFKTVKTKMSGNTTADLTGLTTSYKADLLGAINEINSSLGGSQIYDKFLFVDYNTTFAGTPVKYDKSKPYQTLELAFADFVAGDIIYLVSGNHEVDETITFTNNSLLIFYADKSSIMTKNNAGGTVDLFNMDSKLVKFIGHGTYVNLDTGSTFKNGVNTAILSFREILSQNQYCAENVRIIENGDRIESLNASSKAILISDSGMKGGYIRNVAKINRPDSSAVAGIEVSISVEYTIEQNSIFGSKRAIEHLPIGAYVGNTVIRDNKIETFNSILSSQNHAVVCKEGAILKDNFIKSNNQGGTVRVQHNAVVDDNYIANSDISGICIEILRANTSADLDHPVFYGTNVLYTSGSYSIYGWQSDHIFNYGKIISNVPVVDQSIEMWDFLISNPQIDDEYTITAIDGEEIFFIATTAVVNDIYNGLISAMVSATGLLSGFTWSIVSGKLRATADTPNDNISINNGMLSDVINGTVGITTQSTTTEWTSGEGIIDYGDGKIVINSNLQLQ